MTGPWEIEETDDVAMWLTQLTDTQRSAVESREVARGVVDWWEQGRGISVERLVSTRDSPC